MNDSDPHKPIQRMNAEQVPKASLAQLILDTAAEGFCLFSADEQRVVAFNRQFAELFDLDSVWLASHPTAEEVAKAVYDKEAPRPGKDITDYLQRVMERHRSPDEGEEIEVRFADGRIVVGRTQAAPSGERLYTAQDVSRERRIMRELEAERERLSSMVEHAPVAYYVIDCSRGHVVEVSRSIAMLTGRPFEAFLGPTDAWRQNIHPEDLDLVRSRRAPSIERAEAFDIQYRRIHANGDVRWFREMAELIERPRRGPDDSLPLQMAGVLIDITELKETEARLKESERRFRDLIEGIPDLIFYEHDPDRRLTYLSPSVRKVVGYTPQEMLGARFGEMPRIREDSDLSEAHRFVAEALRTGQRQPRYEIRVQSKTAKTVTLEISEYPVTDKDGNVIKFRGVARDITTVRTMERRLRERERLAILGTFAGGLAHDLNNLLLPIRASLETIERSQSPETVQQRVASIREATNLIGDLVKKLLFWTRQESTLAGRGTETEVRPWVTNAMEFFRESMAGDERSPGEHIDIDLDFRQPPSHAAIDPDLLKQALLNLMLNARDAMPSGGRIELRIDRSPREWERDDAMDSASTFDPFVDDLERAAPTNDENDGASDTTVDAVRFSVTDTGVGMDESVTDRAFDPFFSTKGRGKSTGLGLALVRTIVQSAGGRVRIESELGSGTTIHLDIPAAPGTDQDQGDDGGKSVGSALVCTTDPMLGALIVRALSQANIEGRVGEGDCPTSTERIWIVDPRACMPDQVNEILSRRSDLMVLGIGTSEDRANWPTSVAWHAGPINVAALREWVREMVDLMDRPQSEPDVC